MTGSIGTGKAGYRFSKKSWHAKLNKMIIGESYLNNVDCLCPYFWGTLACIGIFPLFLMYKGIEKGLQALPKTNIKMPNISRCTKDKLQMIVAYSALILAVTSVSALVTSKIIELGVWEVLLWTGLIAGIIVILGGCIVGAVKLAEHIERWYNNKPKKEKKPNLLLEMIKAKKNKHCPLLRWKEDE